MLLKLSIGKKIGTFMQILRGSEFLHRKKKIGYWIIIVKNFP